MTIQSLSYKDLPYRQRRGIKPQAEEGASLDVQSEEVPKDVKNPEEVSTNTEKED